MAINPDKQNQSITSKSITTLKWNYLGRLVAFMHRQIFVDQQATIFAFRKSIFNENITSRSPVY
jgi:hypothetical protein